jgi:hypothetical protein
MYILYITDAFTESAIVTAMKNKKVESGAKVIFQNCFKFGIKTRYIQTREKNVSINYPMRSSSFSAFNIPKPPPLIFTVMLRWKSSTRQPKNIWPFSLMTQHFTK